MLKFDYVEEPIRVHAKCPRHPGYNPAKGGARAIIAGCTKCQELLDVHNAHVKAEIHVRHLRVLAKPFEPVKKQRGKRGQENGAPVSSAVMDTTSSAA
jgi:hypothetical protein